MFPLGVSKKTFSDPKWVPWDLSHLFIQQIFVDGNGQGQNIPGFIEPPFGVRVQETEMNKITFDRDWYFEDTDRVPSGCMCGCYCAQCDQEGPL